jgi:hypothetical protein
VEEEEATPLPAIPSFAIALWVGSTPEDRSRRRGEWMALWDPGVSELEREERREDSWI